MFGSLFRQQSCTPQQSAFRRPDPELAVQVREPEPEPVFSGPVKLTAADQIAADQYLASKPLASEHEGKADKAKKALLASLGLASSGVLPDGRVVSKHLTPVAAEAKPRAATVRTSISIQ